MLFHPGAYKIHSDWGTYNYNFKVTTKIQNAFTSFGTRTLHKIPAAIYLLTRFTIKFEDDWADGLL